MCKCGKCASCKKRMSADKKQDSKTMKGMSPKQKAMFEKDDKKMDAKKPSKKEDTKKDNALARRIKAADKKKPSLPMAKKK